MELAIPLLALGGYYVISNQSQPAPRPYQTKENYSNMTETPKQRSMALTNTQIPPNNYPTVNKQQLADTVQEYPNPNVASDKYFNQTFYATKENAGVNVGPNIPQIYSLSGNYVDTNKFTHSNMLPFNGGKVKGQLYATNTSQSVLDNMVGTGSQLVKKVEQAPLFKPQGDMQWAYGAPNMSDFYQSRVMPGTKINNVKPFETVNVGPGLGKQYSADGTGGFNSGMEMRDSWMPKNVDELRVATNPKQEYSLENLQGPAISNILAVPTADILGKVEKNRPDTFFMNTPDRWFTTVGLEKGNRLVAEEVLQDQSRNETTQFYAGSATSALKTSSYVPGAIESPKRSELATNSVTNSCSVGCGPHNDLDNALNSHTNYTNNRSHNKQVDSIRSGFSSAIGAVIAPIMDILKPVKKEEYVSNIRVYGNATSNVPGSGNYVINPYDTTATTVKETTLFAPNTYIGNQSKSHGAYTVAEQQVVYNQRDTTNTSEFNGASSKYGSMNYTGNYNQYNNESKEKLVVNQPNQGGTQIFNQQMNVNIAKLESDRESRGFGSPAYIIPGGPMKENYGKTHTKQQYEEQQGNSRLDGNLLKPFLDNPYTHSLTGAV
jgi:hypothetical protein